MPFKTNFFFPGYFLQLPKLFDLSLVKSSLPKLCENNFPHSCINTYVLVWIEMNAKGLQEFTNLNSGHLQTPWGWGWGWG